MFTLCCKYTILKQIENEINVILILFRRNRIKTLSSPWRQSENENVQCTFLANVRDGAQANIFSCHPFSALDQNPFLPMDDN